MDNVDSLLKLNTLNMNFNRIKVITNLYKIKELSIVYLNNNYIDIRLNGGSLKVLKEKGAIV